MSVTVTKNVTTVTGSNDVTVEVTENVTSVTASDSTATLTVTPSQTTVQVSGNTTSIAVEPVTQTIAVTTSEANADSVTKTQRHYPFEHPDSNSILGSQPPLNIVEDGDTDEIATFVVHGNSSTVYQTLDLAITGFATKVGVRTEPLQAIVHLRIQRKSKGATGQSIGVVTVADAVVGSSYASYWRKISVSGDVTSKIDSFTWLSNNSSGTNKKRLQNAFYDSANDRTDIFYDNEATGTGLFATTGGTVYVSSSAFESAGTWVTATPFLPDDQTQDTTTNTFSVSDVLPIDANGFVMVVSKTHNLPKLKLVPDSGGSGDIEMRAHIKPIDCRYTYRVLQIGQTNVTRV